MPLGDVSNVTTSNYDHVVDIFPASSLLQPGPTICMSPTGPMSSHIHPDAHNLAGYGQTDASFMSAGGASSAGDASMMSAQSLEELGFDEGGDRNSLFGHGSGSSSILRLDEGTVSEIRHAAFECQERGLIYAARWYVITLSRREKRV